MLSSRDGAIIWDMNENGFALNFLEAWSIGHSESGEQVGTPCCPDMASPAFYRVHLVVSDFRPPRVTESSEAALRRLPTSRAVGGYSLTSDDLALGSLTVFHSS